MTVTQDDLNELAQHMADTMADSPGVDPDSIVVTVKEIDFEDTDEAIIVKTYFTYQGAIDLMSQDGLGTPNLSDVSHVEMVVRISHRRKR